MLRGNLVRLKCNKLLKYISISSLSLIATVMRTLPPPPPPPSTTETRCYWIMLWI